MTKLSFSLFRFKKYLNWLTLLGVIFVLYAAFMSIPWQPDSFSYDLDESFKVALNKAVAARMQFGKDFIYTYGPYGIVQLNKYLPETYDDMVAALFFVGLVAGIGIFRLFVYCWNQTKWSAIFLIPFLFFFPNSGISLDSFHIIIVTLPFLLYFYVDREKISPIFWLTVVAAALVSLVKQTFFTLGFALLLLITIDQVFRRRRFPIILIVYLSCILGFWLLAGQSPANIWDYFANGSQIVKGFTATMGVDGTLVEIIAYLISVGIFLGLMTIATWKCRIRFDLLPIAGLALIFFLAFKGAFVRHDGHAIQSAMTTIPIACLYTALLWNNANQFFFDLKIIKTKIPIILIAWIFLLINASLIFHNYVGQGYAKYYLDAITKINDTGKAALQLISGKTDLQTLYDTSLEKIRQENPLPQVSGTTDLYPNETAVIFAYELPYKPRPVIQSFSAYTGKLAALNAAHLRDSDAPETILFDVAAIDNRLPSSDDGLSWPELLTRYDIADMTGKFLILKRRSTSRDYSFTPLSQQTVKMGEWVELPDNSKSRAIWMQVDARPSFLGKLMTALFKLPPLYMEVNTADGKSEKYRVLADVLNSGQLLSPLVRNREDFAALASTQGQQLLKFSTVNRIRLVTKGWSFFAYPASYSLSLSYLEFPRQDFLKVRGWPEYLSDYKDIMFLTTGKVFNSENRGLEQKRGTGEKLVLLAHAPTRIVLSLPKGAQKLSIGYGILDKAWQESSQNKSDSVTVDGVEFRVLAIYPDNREEILFSQWLDPHVNASDRGEKTITIDLIDVATKQIALETLSGPQDNSNWDWSYWSKAKIE